ncbi:transcription factor mef2A [Lingula anatina]|uniref:Transcription factor mef2A n=1 Tax=Lingula anatina TaxID=7574 RepID=A0A1S3IWV0_LINAN|nr:transcription factor mef2A [Lingula anatina]|eukprot:XP_013402446.1 transcription factor mef2A [Lingula anatina]
MDQLLSSSPVTLIVKAPNQKIDDHKVACCLNWTVKKLKEHLAESYPSKPKEDQQKIIYSGKLLHDHLTLRDVIRQYEEKEHQCHTVHLVCSSSAQHTPDAKSETKLTTSQSPPSVNIVSQSSGVQQSVTPDQSGLRHRGVATPQSHLPTPQSQSEAYQQMFGASPMYASYYQMMQQTAGAPYSPHQMMQYAAGAPYSPQQMMAMQQLYAQQMAQYMQLVQQGGVPQSPTQGVTQPMPPPDANVPAAANQHPANNQRQGNNNQNLVMNAQGGAMFQEEEEEENRDWLDWVYTLSRFSVLLSIVYFYSTLSRFLMVLGFFVLVYIYEAGWLRPRRREAGNGNIQHQQQQQQQHQRQEENLPELTPSRFGSKRDSHSDFGDYFERDRPVHNMPHHHHQQHHHHHQQQHKQQHHHSSHPHHQQHQRYSNIEEKSYGAAEASIPYIDSNGHRHEPRQWYETSESPPSLKHRHHSGSDSPRYESPLQPNVKHDIMNISRDIQQRLSVEREKNPERNENRTNTKGAPESPKPVMTVTKFRPYREVTKPYELSDFYKYSEKLRRQRSNESPGSQSSGTPPHSGQEPHSPRSPYLSQRTPHHQGAAAAGGQGATYSEGGYDRPPLSPASYETVRERGLGSYTVQSHQAPRYHTQTAGYHSQSSSSRQVQYTAPQPMKCEPVLSPPPDGSSSSSSGARRWSP